MAYTSLDTNPLANLVELKSVLVEHGTLPDQCQLQVTLGVFTDDVQVDGANIEVGITNASLVLSVNGMGIVDRSKLGIDEAAKEIDLSSRSETTVSTRAEKSVAAKAIVDGKVSATDLSAGGSLSESRQSSDSSEFKLSEIRENNARHLPVKSVGNNAWRISEPNNEKLDKTYINSDILCELKHNPMANRISTELVVIAKQRYIQAKITEDSSRKIFHRRNFNAKKVIGILVSKALHEINSDRPFEGIVHFSKSTSEING